MRKISLLSSCVAGLLLSAAAAAEPQLFRISLNTGPNHVRNIALNQFIDTLTAAAGDELKIELYPSGQLFKGPDMPKALAQGAVEMGVPIITYISRIVPNAGVVDMPMFYGRSADEIHDMVDGPEFAKLNAEIEAKLGVKVIGRYMDLGHTSVFTTDKEVTANDHLAGLKLRVPGSIGARKRYELLDSDPVAISFTDVPLALSQGQIDGLMTTHESVRSAKLWDSGLSYSFDDFQSFLMYIPLIGKPTWDKLSPQVQKLITDTWEQTIDGMRQAAAERQASAKVEGVQNGIKNVRIAEADSVAFRDRLLRVQDDIADESGIDKAFLDEVQAAFDR